MPEYDAVNYPKPMTPFVNVSQPGRTSDDVLSPPGTDDIAAAWPASPVLPEQYHGAPPAQEWQTNTKHVIVATAVPPVPAPVDPGVVMPSIAPPPGSPGEPAEAAAHR